MSIANYATSVTEHTEILVGVKCSTDLNAESAEYVLKHLDQHKAVVINDAGCTINVNFSQGVSPLSSHWGSFQAHRQVYGLIYISEASNPMDAALVMDKFNRLKEEYGHGVYASRCLIFGIDTAIRQSHSHNIFQFSSHHAWKSIDYDIKQFIVAIYYELETKRLRMSQEKISKPTLLFAPSESPEERNLEIDGKMMRKKFLGRHYKHLADTHLLLGLLSEAVLCYNNALDMLISANDSVWVGCALEGLCVVSAIVLLSELEGETIVQVKEKSSKIALDPRNLAMKQAPASSMTELKKHCISSIKDLVDKYREAIINYSRYKTLAIIELEACIKATKVFAKAKKYLEASEFIQNAVYITLNIPEPERLQRYSVMADLYRDINFLRKSFFYKRVAAMQCVAPHLKTPDWKRCDDLLLSAISSLSSDLSHFPYDIKGNGWPSVIQRVWRELVFSLEKVGDHLLANKHLLHVFLAMFPFMTETEEKETCGALENYAKTHKESAVLPKDKFPFVLNFYKLPIVKAVLPQIDMEGVRPIKSKLQPSPKSVFIYTPSSYQSKVRNSQKVEFDWCVDTACQIDIEIYNPLSHCTLQVSDFSFVIDEDSSLLDCPPVSFSVPAQMTSKIPIVITPLNPGKVKIVGYAFQIFGTQVRCYFEKNDEIAASEVVIHAIPELPLLECISNTTGKIDGEVITVSAFCGEILGLPFTIMNVGQSPVSGWIVSCKTKLNDEIASLLFSADFDGIALDPGESRSLPMKIKPKIDMNAKVVAELHPCIICIKYAAKLNDDIWWRSTSVEIEFKFQRSIVVNHLTVEDAPSENSSQCIVSVTLRSCLDDTAKVHYNSGDMQDQHLMLPPQSIRTCQIPVTKMEHSSKFASAESIENICLDYLKNQLDLKWKFHNKEGGSHSGVVCFECKLGKESICTMLNVPISCSVSLQNCISKHNDKAVKTNQLYSIRFDFRSHGCFSQKFFAQLEVFQDQQNGFIEWNLEDSVLCLGSSSSEIVVEPDQDSAFECDIVFLKAGQYILKVAYDLNLMESEDPRSNIQCSSPSLLIYAEA